MGVSHYVSGDNKMRNRVFTFDDCWYPRDVKRLCWICVNKGLFISPYDLQEAYEEYSDSVCASWLIMDSASDEELWLNIKDYL